MERQEGYYWVKYEGKFQIGFYYADYKCWGLMDNESEIYEHNLEHINENRIKAPGELPD